MSKLNELRRELLEKLVQERLKNYKRSMCRRNEIASVDKIDKTTSKMSRNDVIYPQANIDYRGNVLNKYAKNFYEKHGSKVTEMALESGQVSKSGKVAMTTKHCLKHSFNMCKSAKDLYLVDEKGKRYPLKFNCENCEMEIIY